MRGFASWMAPTALRQMEIFDERQITADFVVLVKDNLPAIARNGHPDPKRTICHDDWPALTAEEAVEPDETLIAGVRQCFVVDSAGYDGERARVRVNRSEDGHGLTTLD